MAFQSAPAEEEDDDDVDLFGEETEEEKKAAEERAAAIKASGKKKESGKSSVLMDVKMAWDDETDMKKLEEAVRSVHLEGLTWGACYEGCIKKRLGFFIRSLEELSNRLLCLKSFAFKSAAVIGMCLAFPELLGIGLNREIVVDAIVNSGPREDATRIGSVGVVCQKAVDISPLRRVNQDISLQPELVKVPSATLKSLMNALLMSPSMMQRVHQTAMASRKRMRLRLEH
ncbi:hypothetical protein QQ045_014402 [Rhodiola kirilowii]